MGFSSGASSAKRKAKKAAAEAYLKAFKKIKGIPEIDAVSAKNSKEIEETLGDNTAFRTRYMAKIVIYDFVAARWGQCNCSFCAA